MKRTPVCGEMVKMFEGLRLRPYVDAVGILTVGYGHTGPEAGLGNLTVREAEDLLERDLNEREYLLDQVIKNNATPFPWEYDALLSFVFNLGAGALSKSTLLKLYLGGDLRGAAAEFSKWRFAGGKPLPGLVKRRRAEAVRFLGGDFPLVSSCYHGGGEQ